MGLGKKVRIKKVWSSKKSETLDDTIPSEELLTIYLNSDKVTTLSCSPSSEIELTVGYLMTSGYLKEFKNIKTIEFCEDSQEKGFVKKVKVQADEKIPETELNKFISSGCGSIDDLILKENSKKVASDKRISSSAILDLSEKVLSNQRLKKQFGGLHSGVLFDTSGNIIVQREDIGRHNCLDKVIGHCFIKKIDITEGFIYTTGRVSFDVVLKISNVNIPCLITNSSVTESAVRAASAAGISLVGYCRGKRFNIYNDLDRIDIDHKIS